MIGLALAIREINQALDTLRGVAEIVGVPVAEPDGIPSFPVLLDAVRGLRASHDRRVDPVVCARMVWNGYSHGNADGCATESRLHGSDYGPRRAVQPRRRPVLRRVPRVLPRARLEGGVVMGELPNCGDGVGIEVFDDVITIEIDGKRVSLDANAAEQCGRRLFMACRTAWTFTAKQHPYYGQILILSLSPTATVGDAVAFAVRFQEENNDQNPNGGVRAWRDHVGRAIEAALRTDLRSEKVRLPHDIACILDYLTRTPGHPIRAVWEDGSSAL